MPMAVAPRLLPLGVTLRVPIAVLPTAVGVSEDSVRMDVDQDYGSRVLVRHETLPGDPSTSSPASPSLVGRFRLVGLVSRSDLNGKEVRILRKDKASEKDDVRMIVELLSGDPAPIRAKLQNIQAFDIPKMPRSSRPSTPPLRK